LAFYFVSEVMLYSYIYRAIVVDQWHATVMMARRT